MMIIPLTRNSYHCLHGCSVFDSKLESFNGDLKFVPHILQCYSIIILRCRVTSDFQCFGGISAN